MYGNFTRQANLARYRRILTTNLTAAEHSFVERRVREEKEALEKLAGSVAPEGTSIDAA